jgi:protein-S-isoprenylcysteine O-methyltransferase Ste14
MKDGLYKIFRNPMYDAYLIFVFPGLSLLVNSWLVMTTFIVNFILLQLFIREEYRYLENKFGDEYKTYLNKVWFKFL